MTARFTVRWSVVLTGLLLFGNFLKETTMDHVTPMLMVGASLLPLLVYTLHLGCESVVVVATCSP